MLSGKGLPRKGSSNAPKVPTKVNVIQSMSRPRTSSLFRGGQLYDPTTAPHKVVEWYLRLTGSPTYQADILG